MFSFVGAKLDGKVMWFSVKWEGGETSFIPANVLNRIAPEKVIQYYESILQFLPNPNADSDSNKEGNGIISVLFGTSNSFISNFDRRFGGIWST